MPISLRERYRHHRDNPGGGRVRFGRMEWAILLGALLVATAVLGLTSNSVSTFRRDIPLSSVAQQIQTDAAQARMAVFEVLGEDTRIDVEKDVFAPLDDAVTSCRALVDGGQTRSGYISPLTVDDDRATAASLCTGLSSYRVMTRTLLDAPETHGEGTQFDVDIDTLFQQISSRTAEVSLALNRSVARDAQTLAVLGRAMAGLVVLTGIVIALLNNRQRRLLSRHRQQVANLASIVDSSGDAIISLTTMGEILTWNHGAEVLYGHTAAEMIGAHGSLLVPAEGQQAFGELWVPVSRGEHIANRELVGVRKDGSQVPLALTLSPIFDGASVRGVSVISRDMSERTARDEELARARNEALEASRLKSEFLATMSHEIRTPLNGVLGLNALLMLTPLDETQRQYADGVEGAGTALLSVINDILDFSKLEAGKVEFDISPFDPRRMVDEVAALVAVPAHLKGVELLADCSAELPAALSGDAGRIRQVLLNLASNAVKFTATGEVLISVTTTDRETEGSDIRFAVRDTGIGIAQEGRRRLFESFSQADASTTRRYGGTGLGLAISQRLVHAMNGEIGVDSELGSGSTFWFTVPLPSAAAVSAPPAEPAAALLPGLRVLVVDDNATNRLILLKQLSGWRMKPEAVEDAASALARMRSAAESGEPYDIAVLDLLMPGMDGLELARLKSADRTLDHTRMIMLTSTAHVDSAELALAGIVEWCTKPVRTSALYDRLMRLMSDGRSDASTSRTETPSVVEPSLGCVLIAEDNEINQMVAEGLVGKLGYGVKMVANGAEAVEALAAASYAAVLMDCHMPVMDGFEATRQIRRSEGDGARTGIIAMTAGAFNEDQERCLAAGMDDYVSKPVTIEALGAALGRWAVQVA